MVSCSSDSRARRPQTTRPLMLLLSKEPRPSLRLRAYAPSAAAERTLVGTRFLRAPSKNDAPSRAARQ